MITLLNDARIAAGKSSLGFLNPFLYQTLAAHPDAFIDITTGDNESGCCLHGFSADVGWDPVTGRFIFLIMICYSNGFIRCWSAKFPQPQAVCIGRVNKVMPVVFTLGINLNCHHGPAKELLQNNLRWLILLIFINNITIYKTYLLLFGSKESLEGLGGHNPFPR